MDANKQKQEAFIESVIEKNPDAFKSPRVIENAEFLRPYGIYIPGKEAFPLGTIKHFPEDFIVEEVQVDGTVTDTCFKKVEALETSAPFIHATLVKCGLSTLEAIEDLSKALGCQKTDIGYSGIKDKDAITSQRISIRAVSIEKILNLTSPHFFLKDLSPSDKPMQKGVIKGNRFTLYIRTSPDFFKDDVTASFVERLGDVQKNGFYNFYYLQRFGMPRLANIEVGLAIMRGEYDKAVKAILTYPSKLENPFMRETRAKILAAFGNWSLCQDILKDVPQLFRDELTLINYLSKKPGQWINALQQLLDKVSVNTYSIPSLFFNEYISAQLELGKEPPKEIPLLLSDDMKDIEMYADMLKAIGIYPFTGRCLRPFSIIRFMKRMVATKDIPELHGASVTDEGVVISFSLGKGQYATTFLAHLFNLVSGEAPDFATDKNINSKEVLGAGDMSETLEYFKEALRSKKAFRSLGVSTSE